MIYDMGGGIIGEKDTPVSLAAAGIIAIFCKKELFNWRKFSSGSAVDYLHTENVKISNSCV